MWGRVLKSVSSTPNCLPAFRSATRKGQVVFQGYQVWGVNCHLSGFGGGGGGETMEGVEAIAFAPLL